MDEVRFEEGGPCVCAQTCVPNRFKGTWIGKRIAARSRRTRIAGPVLLKISCHTHSPNNSENDVTPSEYDIRVEVANSIPDLFF